ncbi:MAG TPA: LysR family transcriptional regulator [Burkholderiaceae bacterium]|nr:LysR family transcriptional regulator [Burkholderiaceae bacterium]
MNASVQRVTARRELGAAELALLLALVRGGTLAAAAQLAGVDSSTVFRTLQRAERALGHRLFERSRDGYRASELGQRLAEHAERIEAELEAARSTAQAREGAVSGLVRISTTDTLLNGLLLPSLRALRDAHPTLRLEINARNELANLTQREADVALRATVRPPPHLVGRHLGPIRSAVFIARGLAPRRRSAFDLAAAPWIVVDDALPEHPSVRWRRKHLPRVEPVLRLSSVQAVFDAVRQGLGVGISPLFLAEQGDDVAALTPPLDECESQLWLLTHPESRHLRRIQAVAAHLAQTVRLT